MLKKTIKYTDLNGVKREEEYYFHLSKAELLDMELSKEGGFVETVMAIVKAKDNIAIYNIFKDLVYESYGEKSADGRSFLKFDENGHRLADKFKQTEAYSTIFTELATNDELAAEFINGLIPADLAKEVSEQKSSNDKPKTAKKTK